MVDGTTKEDKLSHPANVLSSIVVIPDGMLIDSKLLQRQNAYCPIDVILSGRSIDDKLIQPEKASFSIVSRVFGNLTDTNNCLSAKADSPIVVIIDEERSTDSRLEQGWKASVRTIVKSPIISI